MATRPDNWLIGQSPIAFLAIKLALPVLLGVVLWRMRNSPHALISRLLVGAVFVYGVVIVDHAQWVLPGR